MDWEASHSLEIMHFVMFAHLFGCPHVPANGNYLKGAKDGHYQSTVFVCVSVINLPGVVNQLLTLIWITQKVIYMKRIIACLEVCIVCQKIKWGVVSRDFPL